MQLEKKNFFRCEDLCLIGAKWKNPKPFRLCGDVHYSC